jgi:hypothetical protein
LAKRLQGNLARGTDSDDRKKERPDGGLETRPRAFRHHQKQEHGQENCPDRCLLRFIKKSFHPVT